MNSFQEIQEKQKKLGFQGLSANTQRLILEHAQKIYEGKQLYELPVEELRRLRDVEFRGKSFSDAIFSDPEAALKHIRSVLSEEISVRSPNPQEINKQLGHLIRGMDPGDVPENLALIYRSKTQK